MCNWGANRNLWAGSWMGLSTAPTLPLTHKPGVDKSPFQISANRFGVDENVNKAHIRTHWLAWSDPAFSKAPNERMPIEQNLCGRRAFQSPLWWWPCWHFWLKLFTNLRAASVSIASYTVVMIVTNRLGATATHMAYGIVEFYLPADWGDVARCYGGKAQEGGDILPKDIKPIWKSNSAPHNSDSIVMSFTWLTDI